MSFFSRIAWEVDRVLAAGLCGKRNVLPVALPVPATQS